MSDSNKFDAEKLADLLAKVKAATGLEAELDAMLHVIVAEGREWQEDGMTIYAKNLRAPHDCYRVGRIDPGIHQRNFSADTAFPKFTASIDASLALVEKMLPGWEWEVHSVKGLKQFGAYLECDPSDVSAQATTVPLAILQSLLLALTSLSPRGGEE